jgi:hypothetical protein
VVELAAPLLLLVRLPVPIELAAEELDEWFDSAIVSKKKKRARAATE